MLKTLRAFLITFFFALNFKLNAQNFIGITQSNYAGNYAINLNPAHAVDGRYKIHLNLAGVGAGIQNNHLKWAAPYSFFRLVTKTVPSGYLSPTSGLPVWEPSYYETSNANRVKAFVNAELAGPALSLTFPRWGFGISGGVRFRVFGSLTNTSPGIAQAIATGTRNPALQNIDYVDSHSLMNIAGVNEFYGTIAKVLREDGPVFIKVGATAKRLTSNLNLSVNAMDVDYRIEPNSVLNRSQTIQVPQASGSFFHAAANTGTPGFGWLIDQMTSFSAVGNGFGAEIGIVYEQRPDYARKRYKHKGQFIPDPEVNKYALRLGASLTDIGFITFNGVSDVQVGQIANSGRVIPPATFYQIGTTQEFIGDIEDVFDPDSPYGNSFRILMPAKLNLQVDYEVREGFYLGGVIRQSLFGNKRMGPVSYSGLSIIPRFEKKYLEFAFPVSFDQDYTNFNFGATMRAGPLWLGLDHTTGWFGIAKPKSLSAHAGLFLALGHRRPGNSLLDCWFEPEAKQRRKKLFKRK